MEDYIGNVIGIYKILYECDYKSNIRKYGIEEALKLIKEKLSETC